MICSSYVAPGTSRRRHTPPHPGRLGALSVQGLKMWICGAGRVGGSTQQKLCWIYEGKWMEAQSVLAAMKTKTLPFGAPSVRPSP